MLLSKLKVTAGVLLLVVCIGGGAAYRAVAQETAQVRAGTAVAARQAPDDLEALRLEIEALRKEMRAMRERMKGLEAKVQGQERERVGQKDAEQVQWEQAYGMDLKLIGAARDQQAKVREELEAARKAEAVAKAVREKRAKEAAGPAVNSKLSGTYRDRIGDPLADAEAALKKLRQNPNDKQTADQLELALKRLKEQRTPKETTQPGAIPPQR